MVLNLPPSMTREDLLAHLMAPDPTMSALDREVFAPVAEAIVNEIFVQAGNARTLLTPIATAKASKALLGLAAQIEDRQHG